MNKSKILQELQRLAQEIKKENGTSITFEQSYILPFEIGKEYFIRTVTYHLTGRVKAIVGKFLVMEKCAWIADSGRFHEFFETPSSSLEVEPFGKRDVFVNTDSITDASERKVLLEVK